MDKTFLDTKINRKSQLRIVVGLLCIMILYTLLIKTASTVSTDMLNVRKIFLNLANALIFLYLYKFIRYDLKIKLHVIFISIVIFIDLFYIALIPFGFIMNPDPEDGFVARQMSSAIISFIPLIGMVGMAIQLFFNKYFNKKIKIIIQILGASFFVQIIGPSLMLFLITELMDMQLISDTAINTLYRFMNFFNLAPYIVMIYLYLSVLDQPVVEKEL